MLAFDIYKNIQRVFGEEYQPQIELLNKNELELEYLKSAFASFEMEDFSSTTCVVIYSMCTFVTSIISANEYVTNIVNHLYWSISEFPRKDLTAKVF